MIIKDTLKQTLKLESKLPTPNTMKDNLTTSSKFEPKLPIAGIIKK
jgi:hypothetical protein